MNEFFKDEVLLCKRFLQSELNKFYRGFSVDVITENYCVFHYLNSVFSDFIDNGKKADVIIYIDDFEQKTVDRKQKLIEALNSLTSAQKFIYVSLFSFEKGFSNGFDSAAERELTAIAETDTEMIKAKSVVECEKILKAYCEKFDIRVIRFTNLFGPSLFFNGNLSDIIDTFSENKHIVLNKSDFNENFSAVYIRDAVKTIISVLISGKAGNIYNGSLLRLNKAEAKTKLFNILKSDGWNFRYDDGDKNQLTAFLKCDKLRKICKFTETDFSDALYRTIKASADDYISEYANRVYDGKLEILRNAEVDMLSEIDRICSENNIEYFLIGGTLLGAERHQGFIPWDDDIDICMMREEYERFRKICPEKLSDKYAYQSYRTDSNVHYIFDKIRLKHTYFSSEHSDNFDTIENGVFIDVFVFDKTSDIKFLQKIHVGLIVMLRRLIHVKWINKPVEGKFASVSKLLLPFIRLVPFSLFQKMFEIILRFYENKNCHHIIDGTGLYIKKGGFPAEWMNETEKAYFEKGLYPVPVQREKYLKMWYGEDFMTPPEISKRLGHNIARFDLGDYAVYGEAKRYVSLKGELYDIEKGDYYNE